MTFSERYTACARAGDLQTVAEDMCDLADSSEGSAHNLQFVRGGTFSIMEAYNLGQLTLVHAACRLCSLYRASLLHLEPLDGSPPPTPRAPKGFRAVYADAMCKETLAAYLREVAETERGSK